MDTIVVKNIHFPTRKKLYHYEFEAHIAPGEFRKMGRAMANERRPDPTPVPEARIQLTGLLPSIDTIIDEGQVHIGFNELADWPEDTDVSVTLHDPPQYLEASLLVVAPEGASFARINGVLIPLDTDPNGTTEEGQLFQVPFALKDTAEATVGITAEGSWLFLIEWFKPNRQLLLGETLTVSRDPYTAPSGVE